MAVLDLDANVVTYYSGAASTDGGTQTTAWDSLGTYRAATSFVNDSAENLFDAILKSEASSGVTHYCALFDRNTAATTAYNYGRYIFDNTQTTASAAAAGTGAATISLTSFTPNTTGFDTPNGYVKNVSTSEIMFYNSSSATLSQLYVAATGRAARGGAAATAISAGDTFIWYPWCEMMSEVSPAAQTTGAIQTIANITTAPTTGVNTSTTWSVPLYDNDADGYANKIDIDNNSFGADLIQNYNAAFWYRFIVPTGTNRNPSFDINRCKKIAEG